MVAIRDGVPSGWSAEVARTSVSPRPKSRTACLSPPTMSISGSRLLFPGTRVVPARIRLSELRRTSEGVGKSLPCLHACSQPLAAYIGPVGVATACMSSITAASTQFGSGKSSAHLLNTVLLRSTRPVRGVVLTVQRRTFATIIATAPQQQVRIQSIRPSSSERAQGKLSRRHKQTALEALHHDGVVVLENAIDPAILDRLNERMSHDTRTLIDRGTDGPSNYNLGNLQQSPPYELASFSPSIPFHPLATDLTSSYLGGQPALSFISSNAAVKADQAQPVHNDADFAHPTIPFAAVVNVGLVDMAPINGSTELWLGTHTHTTIDDQEGAHGERASGRIKQACLNARRALRPPFQPTVRKGSLVIRDLRLWHAGMPNRCENIRIMVAMIHFAPWYRQRMTLDMPKAFQPLISQQRKLGIAIPARFESETIDQLDASYGNSFDFDQDP